MYCKKCGAEIDDEAVVCPKCGVPVSYSPKVASDDAPSTGFAVLGFFFPLIGLILFLIWNTERPLKAKSCGKGALIGVIAGVVFGIILAIIYGAILGSMLSSLSLY